MRDSNTSASSSQLRRWPFFSGKSRGIHGLQARMTISYVWLTVTAALFLEIIGLLVNGVSLWPLSGGLIRNSILLFLITAAVGELFGLVTTRRVIKRIRHLVAAAAHFARGNYAQRVEIGRADEIGQLERQFNWMAEQLVQSIALHQQLAEQNACIIERARISRELHDAISQQLFSLRTLADGLQSAVRAGVPSHELEPYIGMIQHTTMTMTREMRALLLEMRPPQLEGLTFLEAMEELASIYTARLGITVKTALASLTLHPEVEDALLRITQEALHNAARHANATQISLSLTQEKKHMILSIEDNGQGFCEKMQKEKRGLGLRLMRERVEDIQGRFLLASAPGLGTRIQIFLEQEETV